MYLTFTCNQNLKVSDVCKKDDNDFNSYREFQNYISSVFLCKISNFVSFNAYQKVIVDIGLMYIDIGVLFNFFHFYVFLFSTKSILYPLITTFRHGILTERVGA